MGAKKITLDRDLANLLGINRVLDLETHVKNLRYPTTEHAWRRRVVARFLKESLTLPVFKVYSNVEQPRALKVNHLC